MIWIKQLRLTATRPASLNRIVSVQAGPAVESRAATQRT
jgi:hypothetical protein